MTFVNTVRDDRVWKTGHYGNSYQVGILKTRYSYGSNRSSADRLAKRWPDHEYFAEHATTQWGEVQNDVFKDFGSTRDFTWYYGDQGNAVTYLLEPVTNNDYIVALGRLANTIRLHDWNAAIFVGEIGKTTELISDRARQLAQAALAVKRGQVTQAITLLKSSPGEFRRRRETSRKTPEAPSGTATWYSTWLEMRYAWRPLMKDIFDLSEAIRTRDAPRKTTVRSSFTRESLVGSAVPKHPSEGGGFYNALPNGRVSIRYKYTFTEPPLTLARHLGLMDPDEVAWELTPLSFVADWFIPIGNYIRTRNVLKVTSGVAVQSTVHSFDSSLKHFKKTPLDHTIERPSQDVKADGRKKYKRLERVIIRDGLNVPLPTFRNPAGPNPGTRALDAIALVRAVFGPR